MDKASDFGSEDCRFESCRGRSFDSVHYKHLDLLQTCITTHRLYFNASAFRGIIIYLFIFFFYSTPCFSCKPRFLMWMQFLRRHRRSYFTATPGLFQPYNTATLSPYMVPRFGFNIHNHESRWVFLTCLWLYLLCVACFVLERGCCGMICPVVCVFFLLSLLLVRRWRTTRRMWSWTLLLTSRRGRGEAQS